MKHLRARDARFLFFVIANILCIATFLSGTIGTSQAPAGGWRRIDLDALTVRIESGDLMEKEADWYHPLEELDDTSSRQ